MGGRVPELINSQSGRFFCPTDQRDRPLPGTSFERTSVGTDSAYQCGVDWGLVEVDRLQGMRCPSCQRALGGGLMRQVEWSTRRCVVVVVCPNCTAECLAILEARITRQARGPIDVDDVRRAHDLLSQRDWQVSQLFAA